MNTMIMLLRGINVGGKNILRMAELRAVLQEIGLEQVKTYIQSGNVVFQSAKNDRDGLVEEISMAIEKSHGLNPQILLLTVGEWQEAMAANPFPEGESEPKNLHLFFLASIPDNPDFGKLEALEAESEQFQLIDHVFYLYAPEGIGRSKLATSVEKALGVPVTARNWRTVEKIMDMAGDLSA
jgi:uncharacterized protein (DUF1697 family)